MGKNVLIIGASGDIGSAIAIHLANTGYNVMLHYHTNYKAIKEIRGRIDREAILCELQADLTKDAQTINMLRQIAFPVHAIIFASGMAHYGLFQDTPEKVMDDLLSIHLKAPWVIAKELLPMMIREKSGKIIMITSIWGETGASNEVVYSAVKGAQNSFVKALAKEIGPSGISVNAISPGYIETKMNRHFHADEKEQIFSQIPLHRAGTPEEIAYAVGFLLEEKANYIHGEIIRMGGGW